MVLWWDKGPWLRSSAAGGLMLPMASQAIIFAIYALLTALVIFAARSGKFADRLLIVLPIGIVAILAGNMGYLGGHLPAASLPSAGSER